MLILERYLFTLSRMLSEERFSFLPSILARAVALISVCSFMAWMMVWSSATVKKLRVRVPLVGVAFLAEALVVRGWLLEAALVFFLGVVFLAEALVVRLVVLAFLVTVFLAGAAFLALALLEVDLRVAVFLALDLVAGALDMLAIPAVVFLLAERVLLADREREAVAFLVVFLAGVAAVAFLVREADARLVLEAVVFLAAVALVLRTALGLAAALAALVVDLDLERDLVIVFLGI